MNSKNQTKMKRALIPSHTAVLQKLQPAPGAVQPAFASLLPKLFPKWWDSTQPSAPSRNASPRAGCTLPSSSSTSPGPDAGLRPTGRVGERSCAGADLWLASLSIAGWRGWARMTEDDPAVSQELTQSPARRSSFSTASRLGGGMSRGNGWRLVR